MARALHARGIVCHPFSEITTRAVFLLAFLVPLASYAHAGQEQPRALIEVLRETGSTRDGLPIYERHPDAARYVSALCRGFSGRLLKLYALEQNYLRAKKGIQPEPAYLLLSGHMGGFPRFGFYLGSQKKATAGYVDLPARNRIAGAFGSVDQIFPHELAHVMLVQLSGPPGGGGSNQIHAIGVRTDRVNAFHEGFAEHTQVLAVDDSDALAETRALLRDDFFERRARSELREYTTELKSHWPLPGRRRLAFPFWFSSSEQALRYYAVKRNAFARQPQIPPELFGDNPYAAYLLENILPGHLHAGFKNPSQLASTEGVVSAFFVAFATDATIAGHKRDASFYEPFGVGPEEVSPLENAYLKLFDAFFAGSPRNLTQAIAALEATFPDEADAFERVAHRIAGNQSLTAPEPLWMANDSFKVGTSLFDQFRGMPRTHTFDLNAASAGDLTAVPGVDSSLAEEIRRGIPYDSVAALGRVKGMSAAVVSRFADMEKRSRALHANAASEEESLSFSALLVPYAWRILLLLVACSILGAAAYRMVVPVSRFRAFVNAFAAALVGFLLEVSLDLPMGLVALVAPVLLLGIPGALFCLAFPSRLSCRFERLRPHPVPRLRVTLAAAILLAWMLASAPLVVLMTPFF